MSNPDPGSYEVFLSHATQDSWIAGQMAALIRGVGGTTFLAEHDIPKGHPNFKNLIQEHLEASQELVALLTPSSVMRSWVWIEIGAAWISKKSILAVFYGMTLDDLDKSGQGKAILEVTNVIALDGEFDIYVDELSGRITNAVVQPAAGQP